MTKERLLSRLRSKPRPSSATFTAFRPVQVDPNYVQHRQSAPTVSSHLQSAPSISCLHSTVPPISPSKSSSNPPLCPLSWRFITPPFQNLCAFLVSLVLATCAVHHSTRWTLYNRYPLPLRLIFYITQWSDYVTLLKSNCFPQRFIFSPCKFYDSRELHWPWQWYRQEQSDR